MKLLALLLLTMNVSYAANQNLESFKAAKKSLIAGVFTGKLAYSNDPCVATLAIDHEQIVASIEFLNWEKKTVTSSVSFKPTDAEALVFDPDLYGEEEQRTAQLTKSKEIPEPGNDGMFLSIFESVVQEIDGDRLLSLTLEEAIVNEHSDPSESRIECRINL